MSSNRNTLVRSLHDLGAAAWFGGSLMGAVALNGASQDIKDPTDRATVASAGWARWAPASAAAIGAHLVGGLGLVLANRNRIGNQSGVQSNTVAKTIVTGAAMATTAYSGVLGAKLAQKSPVPAQSGVKPNSDTPADVAKTQQQLRLLQWATPVLTAAIIVMGAQQGEQQKPAEMLRGFGQKVQDYVTS